jgi:uncharacterized membrane protein YciS (DUF1049 family)
MSSIVSDVVTVMASIGSSARDHLHVLKPQDATDLKANIAWRNLSKFIDSISAVPSTIQFSSVITIVCIVVAFDAGIQISKTATEAESKRREYRISTLFTVMYFALGVALANSAATLYYARNSLRF